VGLISSFYPLQVGWRASRGTGLRAAVAWAYVAAGFALLSQASAWTEVISSGRPLTGHFTYLSVLATLAALISVLNARRPGGGAWAILMTLLVVVFLIPWLEGPGLARKAHGLSRLRLDAPWTLFYGFLVLAGITNYLPTTFGLAAGWLALGFVAEYVGLTWNEAKPSLAATIWLIFPWTLSVALWSALGCGGGTSQNRDGLARAWLWFRNHWGVVWALRTQERFNRSAEASGWPVRLAWNGVVSVPGTVGDTTVVPEGALTTFLGLLRRFADSDRIQELVGQPEGASCQRPDVT